MMRTRNRTVRAAAAIIAAVIAGTAACRSRPPAAAPNPVELARTVLMETGRNGGIGGARLLPARPGLRLRRPSRLLPEAGLSAGLDRRPPRPGRCPRFHRRPAPGRPGRPQPGELSPGRGRIPDRRDRRRPQEEPWRRPARGPGRSGDAPDGRVPPVRLAPRPWPGQSGDHPVRMVHQGARRGPGGGLG